jgi:uncharacterized membrane protein
MESFSDGVIAVAITLLVLNIMVPTLASLQLHHESLAHALGHQWPAYAGYATSFITIGIIWINHHVMIGRLRRTDHSILILNILLLLTIGVLPFATDLLAQYLNAGHGQHLAAAIYGGALTAMSVTFFGLNAFILLRRTHMLRSDLSEATRRRILARGFTGVPPYIIATAVAPVSQYATLAISAGIGVFYALPISSGGTQATA